MTDAPGQRQQVTRDVADFTPGVAMSPLAAAFMDDFMDLPPWSYRHLVAGVARSHRPQSHQCHGYSHSVNHRHLITKVMSRLSSKFGFPVVTNMLL